MNRNEILFIGGCIVAAAGVIAIPLGALAYATVGQRPTAMDMALIPGILAVLGGSYLCLRALSGMKADKE